MMHKQSNQDEILMMTMEQMVPQDNVLRIIDKHIDFEFIYDLTKPLYSHTGAPSVDPVNIFKIELINIIEGYTSIRKTCKKINLDVSHRWFLKIPFGQPTPHFSTISKVYKRKFEDNDVYQNIFDHIIEQLVENRLLNTDVIYIDGTHIKANANKNKKVEIEVEKPENAFIDEIYERINETRVNDGMKPFEIKDPGTKKIKVSTTDPECGYFVKGEKEKQMAYVAQVVCDDNGYALDCDVVAGNIHDSQSCKPVLERVLDKFEIDAVAADAGYKTGPIAQLILSHDALFFTAYTRPRTKEGFFKKADFIYDVGTNTMLCPNDKVLTYAHTTRAGYKMFLAKKENCKDCYLKSKCTKSDRKSTFLSVFHDELEFIEELRLSETGKCVYKKRKEKIERLFADGKEKHGMRYTRLRGRNRVRNSILLTLACMNIKKMALHLERMQNKV